SPHRSGGVSRSGLLARPNRPELGTPGPDRLVGDHDAADEHQVLDVAQAQRETVIQPHRVPDDLDRIPVALVPRRNRHKRPILAAPHQVNNLTMPDHEIKDIDKTITERFRDHPYAHIIESLPGFGPGL